MVPCWAIIRRHFYRALDDAARMGAVLAYIAKLYAVEKSARASDIVGADLRLLRQRGSLPVLHELRVPGEHSLGDLTYERGRSSGGLRTEQLAGIAS
jgi:hypothetical protein